MSAGPSLLELTQLFFVIATIPLYILFLHTIVRNKHASPFKSEFFTFCLSLGVADLVQILNNWIFIKFPLFGWVYMDVLVRRFNNSAAKLHVMIAWMAGLCQLAHIFVIAVSRTTAIVASHRHSEIWTTKFVGCVIGSLWLMFSVAVVPQFFLPFGYNIHNATGEVLSPPLFLDITWMAIYFTGGFIYNISMNMVILILYVICFCQVKKQLHSESGAQENVSNRSDLKLLLFGFSVFLVMFGYALFQLSMALMPANDLESYKRNVLVYAFISDLCSGCNPWLCILLAPTVRKRMINTVLRKNEHSAIVRPYVAKESKF